MHTFIVDSIIEPVTILSEQESKHCIKVLRKNLGDDLLITDGKGKIAKAFLSDIQSRNCSVTIESVSEFQIPYSNFHLVIAPTKQMDRIEWMLEKLCEIGLGGIHLIQTKHSIRKQWKVERLNKIVESAVKQSGSAWKAEICSYDSIQDCYEAFSNEQHYIMQQSGKWFQEADIEFKGSIFVWVGPEGDFSSQELEFFNDHSVPFIRLNSSRLRTETAGFQAINMLHWLCGTF